MSQLCLNHIATQTVTANCVELKWKCLSLRNKKCVGITGNNGKNFHNYFYAYTMSSQILSLCVKKFWETFLLQKAIFEKKERQERIYKSLVFRFNTVHYVKG